MCAYQFILCLLLVISSTPSTKCGKIEIYGWSHTEGFCEAQSYTPGNKYLPIKTTEPTAVIQKDAFQAFFTHVRTGHVAGVAGIGSTLAGTLENIGEKIGKAGSRLAPALGIIAGVMDTIIGDKTPTAEDILDATNKALETMTNELDKRVDEMVHYVDGEIINLLKNVNHGKYKFLYAYWADCIKGPASESELCQREANRLIQASVYQFALYSDQMNKEGVFIPELTVTERKTLEVNLVLFRNYVFLSLMATKAVAATYEDKKDVGLSKLYNQELERIAKFYKTYADSAIKEIIKLNTDFGLDALENTYKNGETVSRSNGYFDVIFYNEFGRECEAVLSPLMPKSHTCRAQALTLFRMNDWKPSEAHHFKGLTMKNWQTEYTEGIEVRYKGKLINTKGKMDQSVADFYCRQVLLEKQDAYKKQLGQEIIKYWKREVQQVTDCGQKLVGTEATSCDETEGSGSESE